jgi:hypothetical protein
MKTTKVIEQHIKKSQHLEGEDMEIYFSNFSGAQILLTGNVIA